MQEQYHPSVAESNDPLTGRYRQGGWKIAAGGRRYGLRAPQ
jgi:hypothetical protein